MTRMKDVEEIYHRFGMQISAILNLMENNYRATARVVGWLYGGSPETWRKFLAEGKTKEFVPIEVKELLAKMRRKQS